MLTATRPASRRTRYFTPPVTAGLVRYYDARTLVGDLADAARTLAWRDLGPHGADLSPGASSPWFKRDAWDGKPGVLFNGQVELVNTSNTGRPTKDMTVFAVTSCGYKGLFPEVCNWGNGSTNGWDLYWYTGAAPVYRPSLIRRGTGAAWGDHWAVQATATKLGRRDPTILTGYVSGGTTGVRWDKGNEFTDAGTDVATDYGAGTVKLCVGGKFGTNLNQDAMLHALLIFDRKLSAGDITLVENWLDRQWRVGFEHRQYDAWFNGSVDGGTYRIGRAWSPDGRHWRRPVGNPVLSNGTGWESSHVKDPWVMYVGGQWVMYYAGYNGTNYQVGRATSSDGTTWTKAGGNPLVALGAGGTFDDTHVYFPCVVYDAADADSTKRYKMLYGADDGAGVAGGISVGYATSPDGVTWTKQGQVMTAGAAGTWDGGGVGVGCFRYNAALTRWELWYQGVKASTGVWQGGFATATTPAGPWTKHGSNPQAPASRLTGLSGHTTFKLLGSNLTTQVAVFSAANYGWEQWEPLAVIDTGSDSDLMRLVERVDASTAQLSNSPDNQMDAATGSMRTVFVNSVILRSLVDRGAELVGYGTAFQIWQDVGYAAADKFKELSFRSTAPAPEGPFTFDHTAGVMMTVDADLATFYDHRAAENPCVVLRPQGT